MLLAWCVISTICWGPSGALAAATLENDGTIRITADDGRALVGEIRGLRAEHSALRTVISDDRRRIDSLAAQVDAVADSLRQERDAREALQSAMEAQAKDLQRQVRAERAAGWQRSVLALLLGAGVGWAVGQ
jgi:hypothetical protein